MKKYATIRNYARLHHKQAGMTLIELTVVLMILIGLAGLMIPYVSGFVDKTHDSTTTDNLAELNNNVQLFRTSHMSFPDRLESLVDATGALYSKTVNKNYLLSTALNATHVSSLSKAGLVSVYDNDNATTDATFKSTTGAERALVATGKVATIGAPAWAGTAVSAPAATADFVAVQDHLAYAFGGKAADYDVNCNDYVVMGIGDGNEMIGKTMSTAPVVFQANGDLAPQKKYDRFLAVFKVQKSVGTIAAGASTTGAAVTCVDQPQPATFVGSAVSLDFPEIIGPAASISWSTGRMTQ